MNKQIAIELDSAVKIVADRFSRTDREMNHNNETFHVDKIYPTGDHTATVMFKKSSGKLGAAFFYYIPNGMSKGWKYFFPTDSHIIGMRAFEWYKLMAENENYQHNFKS
jgi:hypothetical protein